jgi:hypothetical protein
MPIEHLAWDEMQMIGPSQSCWYFAIEFFFRRELTTSIYYWIIKCLSLYNSRV